ncbi:MAG: class I SAM-dependent methyltransferase [Planctomycetes bacterium]|nr:class I SAM-dependent methyltransferase [Planctomycetota bacterium]
MEFNHVVRLFRDEFQKPGYGPARERVNAMERRLVAAGRPWRRDTGRSWEYSHVLLALDRLLARRPGAVVDFGGGNGALAYVLAAEDVPTTVLDLDAACIEAVRGNASALCLHRLTAQLHSGRSWPLPDASAEAVVAVSVYESILRPLRPWLFAEARRVLAPGGSLLMTLDYGPEARFVGDAPATIEDLRSLVAASGMELVGAMPTEPSFDPEVGPPVKALVPTLDGEDTRAIAYSFAALHLRSV